MEVIWEAFDCNKPLSGLYWVVVETHGIDICHDDFGNVEGGEPTGEIKRHVALVAIENDPEHPDYAGPEIEAVNNWETGDYEPNSIFTTVKLIATFTMPECPLQPRLPL